MMDNVRYMCFCKSIFVSLNSFRSHKLCCDHFMNDSNISATLENMSLKGDLGTHILEHEMETRPTYRIKINESRNMGLDVGQEIQRSEKLATNLWGRRLPRRTRVPYLSRAVPLSTDHSYERCPCGAVFVTRMGKRQHQARFCNFVKNKTRKIQSNETVTIGTQTGHVTRFSAVKNGHFEYSIITEEIDSMKAENGGCLIELKEDCLISDQGGSLTSENENYH